MQSTTSKRRSRLLGFGLAVAFVLSLAAEHVAAAPRSVRKDLQVEDLGTPVKRRKIGASVVYRAKGTDHLHLFLTLTGANELGNDPPYQMLDFDLDTGAVRTAMGCEGSGGRCWLHSNGKLYITQGRPPNLVEYDPDTGKARLVGRMTANYFHAAQSVDEAPDGKLYVGYYGRHVCSYDPATDKIEDLGAMGGESNTYIYTIAADGRYVYCGIAESGKWYLIVYDTQTRQQQAFPDLKGGIRRTADGNIYFADLYLLKDGQPVKQQRPPKAKPGRNERMWAINEVEAALNMEIDLDDINPNNWNNGSVTLRWRAKDAQEWRSASFTGVDLVPNPVKAMAPTPDGKLLGLGAWYGPVFLMDPATGKTEYLGPAAGSVYDMLCVDHMAYFAGYSSLFAVYDRSKPYTLSPKNEYYYPDQNPYRLPSAKWTTRIVAGADGRIYAAGNDARHTFGGVLIAFDPKTGERIDLTKDVRSFSIRDMCAIDHGKRLVLSTTERTEQGDVVLIVYDTTSHAFTAKTHVALEPKRSGALLQSGPDEVLSLSRLSRRDEKDPNVEIHEFLVHRADLKTGKVVYEQKHPGKAFTGPIPTDRFDEFCVGPDGCGWLFIDNYLSRVHPDGTVEKVLQMKHGARILFLGDDLYLYNGGRQFFGGFSQVLRIRSVFE